MPPYNPPVAHYSQCEAKELNDKQVLELMGRNGCHFKEWSKRYGVNYIWWDSSRKVIELWGPLHCLKKAKPIIEKMIKETMTVQIGDTPKYKILQRQLLEQKQFVKKNVKQIWVIKQKPIDNAVDGPAALDLIPTL
jgi:hypothetical protein